ncbi:recombinase family protein [Egbenema bharatensis]|uniref:recombinase family protein n=1 Tax=Egbenema bharatensis TaxID=3463334 RepID=UPI003A842EBC
MSAPPHQSPDIHYNPSASEGEVFAYSYSDPLLESVPNVSVWGHRIDRVYQDMGDRQQLQQLIADCRSTVVACVLMRRLDELGDSVQEISDRLAELEALEIPLIVTSEGRVTAEERGIEAANHSGEPPGTVSYQHIQRSDLLYLLQTLQDRQRSRRLQQGHARNRVKALPPPGKAPYGYRRGKERYAIDRTTAPIVKEFFEHFLLYGSLRSSVRHLQKKYNKRISVSTGQRWLTSPVYRGDLAYHNGEVVQNTHAAILSREEAAQIDRLLRRNRRMPSRTASSPRSLSGLVICHQCQSPMKVSHVTAPRKNKAYLYLCPTTCPQQPKCRSLPYQTVLEQTIQQICQTLPQAVADTALPDVDRIKQGWLAEISAKQDILKQLPDLVESGILDPETAQLRSYKLQTEIAALSTRLDQLPPVNLKTIAQVVSIPQFWFDLSEAERRFYFREFIQHIQIDRHDSGWAVQLVFIF